MTLLLHLLEAQLHLGTTTLATPPTALLKKLAQRAPT